MVSTRVPGRSSPPPTDAATDDLVTLINDMITRRTNEVAVKLGTITNIRGDDAQVSVQRWDEDAGGQQFRARLAGTAFRNGDAVVIAPTGGGEYVVLGKIANSNADKAVVGPQELLDNAITPRHIAQGAIPLNRLAAEVATTAQLVQATNGLASQATMNQHVANLQAGINSLQQQLNELKNNPAGVTMAQVNNRLNSGLYFDHKHETGEILVETKRASYLNSVLLQLRGLAVCTYQNRNKAGNPCGSRITALQRIL